MQIFDLTVLISVIGALTVLTNLLVEVVKKTVKVPANILAVLVAVVLTLVTFFAWADIVSLAIPWYHTVAAVVVGFLVAYAAMFGFDKLKETLLKLKEQR